MTELSLSLHRCQISLHHLYTVILDIFPAFGKIDSNNISDGQSS